MDPIDRPTRTTDMAFCTIEEFILKKVLSKVKKYGLPMLLPLDEGLKSFLVNLTSSLSELQRGRKETSTGLEENDVRLALQETGVEKAILPLLFVENIKLVFYKP